MQEKILAFRNRLEKVHRHRSKVARKAGIDCYRLYDHDLPEAPFAIDRYADHLAVAEYQRQHTLSEEAHEAWLQQCMETMSAVTGVATENIHLRRRQRHNHREGQYEKRDQSDRGFAVGEGGLQFWVNLDDYLDTGLFLDHRATRQRVREESAGKRVLNLFCYTSAFSVHAAAGGAVSVTDVDMSNTYLAWGEKNWNLNDLPPIRTAVSANAVEWLASATGVWDLIVLDPPTFSNSKRMKGLFEIQRDHPGIIRDCLRILSPGGVLYFSTNFTRFALDPALASLAAVQDITRATTPFDFEGKLKRPCFRFAKA